MRGLFVGRIVEVRRGPSKDGKPGFPKVSISISKPDSGTLICGTGQGDEGAAMFERVAKMEDQIVNAVVNVRDYEGRIFFDLVGVTPVTVPAK
jgi:hypothetical protein